jgi:hypothetical protein
MDGFRDDASLVRPDDMDGFRDDALLGQPPTWTDFVTMHLWCGNGDGFQGGVS